MIWNWVSYLELGEEIGFGIKEQGIQSMSWLHKIVFSCRSYIKGLALICELCLHVYMLQNIV